MHAAQTLIRIVLMMAGKVFRPLRNAHAKYAFLHTGAAQRNIYVVPSCECNDQRLIWRSDTAAYG